MWGPPASEEGNLPEDFVWLRAQFQIEPAELAVVTTYDEVVAGRVDVHRGDPPASGRESFEELLFGEVVHPHVALRLRPSIREAYQLREGSDLTATKRYGLMGWNRTSWIAPLTFLKGACECLLDN